MIALIEIPHQLAARIVWYKDESELINAALDYMEGAGCTLAAGFGETVHNAAVTLAYDWNGHLLVESADDIQAVRDYTGHQLHKVRAMAEELEAAFLD